MKTQLTQSKLGYGGTKSEMERLLADAQAITGVKYDINNLSDVYSAIHVIQGELGITGTTANEAATTVSGSFGMLKSSFTDLLGNLALGQNVSKSLQNVITSAGTFMANLIPMVVNVIVSIPQAIIGALPTLLPTLQQTGQTIIQNLTGGATMSIPEFLDKAVEMISGFATKVIESLPTIISCAGQLINTIITTITTYLPMVLSKGVELVGKIASGFIQNLPKIVSAAANLITSIVQTIGKNLPTILQQGIKLIGQIVAGVIRAIPQIIAAMPKVISAVKDAIVKVDWIELGKNIIRGIISGIKALGSEVGGAIKDVANQALTAAKNALGIHSPSKVFADSVGQYIPAGIAEGITDNMSAISDAMQTATNATTSAFTPSIGGTGQTTIGGITLNVYGAEGQSVNELADIIEDRLNSSIARREAVFASWSILYMAERVPQIFTLE